MFEPGNTMFDRLLDPGEPGSKCYISFVLAGLCYLTLHFPLLQGRNAALKLCVIGDKFANASSMRSHIAFH